MRVETSLYSFFHLSRRIAGNYSGKPRRFRPTLCRVTLTFACQVARQMPPPPPPPSPPQPQDIPGYPEVADMFEEASAAMGASRNRREAKGGGAMPTRKG